MRAKINRLLLKQSRGDSTLLLSGAWDRRSSSCLDGDYQTQIQEGGLAAVQ